MDPTAYSNSNCYVYQPLTSSCQIRLLVLQRGRWDQPLEGTLRLASLDEAPHYEALSYVWGSTTDQRPFCVSGNITYITTNLDIALRYLRREHGNRVLWVDAICINQMDLDERSQQVLKMAQIFKSARKILAWTGEAEPDSEEGIMILMQLALLGTRLVFSNAINPPLLEEIGFDIKSTSWSKLDHLLNREYWLRMWVLQELAVNFHNVVFLFGKFSLRGDVFEYTSLGYQRLTTFPNVQDDYDQIVGERPNGLYSAFFLCTLVRASKIKPDLQTLLQLTDRFKATDPRDKVYALLNLVSDFDREAIKPDYRKSHSQLKLDVTMHFIRHGYNLRCLEGNRPDPSEPGYQRPSWAQFQSGRDRHSFKWEDLGLHRPSGDMPTDARLAQNPGSLSIRGLAVDLVDLAHGPFKAGPEFQDAIFAICEAFSILPSHERCNFWRSIVMDSEMMPSQPENITTPAPHHFETAFEFLATLSQDELALETLTPFLEDLIRSFLWNCEESIRDRCIIATKSGYYGIGPRATKKGDLVVVFYGSKWCHVLRWEDDHWLLLGDAYVQGVMQAQLLTDPGRIETTFELR